MEVLATTPLVLVCLFITLSSALIVIYTIVCVIYLVIKEGKDMKEEYKKTLEEILDHISYIETNSDDMSVLAECELIRTIIKKQLKGE